MWARTIQGKTLTFHLAGIHNQNFLMRDEETGSFWQQVSGECIAGPMRGARLDRVHSDELTLARFAAEAPAGDVLLGDPVHADNYERDWEPGIDRLPTVVDTSDSPLPPRALVAGITAGGQARAYEASRLAAEPVLLDEIGDVPIVLWSRGGRMIRAFERRVDGMPLLLAPARRRAGASTSPPARPTTAAAATGTAAKGASSATARCSASTAAAWRSPCAACKR